MVQPQPRFMWNCIGEFDMLSLAHQRAVDITLGYIIDIDPVQLALYLWVYQTPTHIASWQLRALGWKTPTSKNALCRKPQNPWERISAQASSLASQEWLEQRSPVKWLQLGFGNYTAYNDKLHSTVWYLFCRCIPMNTNCNI